MVQASFGTVLRNARERKGYDIATAARRLRIRPDILTAIEASDFDRMPPRGYARNMVNAYARFLGLNPTEITSMYLDENYAYQVKIARANAKPTGFENMDEVSTRKPFGLPLKQESGSQGSRPRQSSLGRTLVVDDRNSGRYRNGGTSSEVQRLYPEERAHRTNRAAVPTTQYTNFYSGPKPPRSRLLYIIVGAVVLIALIVILVMVFAPKGTTGNDVQKVPVTGVSDSGGSSDQAAPVKTPPSKVVFEYEVASGGSSWIEIYIDGVIKDAGTVAGPVKVPYDVTSVLRLDTANPSVVKVYQDGVEVPLTDTDGDSVYSVTINFPAIQAQWYKDNPGTSPATTPSNGTGSAASGGSSASRS